MLIKQTEDFKLPVQLLWVNVTKTWFGAKRWTLHFSDKIITDKMTPADTFSSQSPPSNGWERDWSRTDPDNDDEVGCSLVTHLDGVVEGVGDGPVPVEESEINKMLILETLLHLSRLMTQRWRMEEVEASTSNECQISQRTGPNTQLWSIPWTHTSNFRTLSKESHLVGGAEGHHQQPHQSIRHS